MSLSMDLETNVNAGHKDIQLSVPSPDPANVSTHTNQGCYARCGEEPQKKYDSFDYLHPYSDVYKEWIGKKYSRVCKSWNALISDRWLWKRVSFYPHPISKQQLIKIIRRYFTSSTSQVDICGNLRRQISSYSISNNVLKLLSDKSPNLKTFKLEDEHLDGIYLKLLPSNLEHLSFSTCEIPSESLAGCKGVFSRLRSLTLRRCPCINSTHLQSFGKLTSLERLEMYGCYRVSSDGVRIIARDFPNLKTLVLIGCAYCDDDACVAISRELHNLRCLEIEEWIGLTARGVKTLREMKSVKFLSVKCQQLFDNRVTTFGSRLDLDAEGALT